MQTALGELLQNTMRCPFDGAGCIDIFDTNQPLAVMHFSIQPTRQCRHQGAGM